LLSKRFHLPAAVVSRQALVTQGLNLLDQGLMIANFLRLVCGLAALVLVAFLFPVTRFGSEVVFYQAIALLITWLLLLVARFGALLLLNYNVQSWVRRMSAQEESNRRYALRGVTYSRVLRGALTLLMVVVGLVISLLLLGVDQRVFTGAGVLAVGVGLLARNLLEDLLNGAMNLYHDRYAIGDVITIPPHSGFVESLNLFITQLRGWDGQVITLPNGQIRVVENLTKDWSRVNFEIEVQLDQDLRQVLQLARHVADGLAADPDWADCLIGTPDVLGVDAINHQVP
jgi:Small-conductance mechanosensitive channel